MVTRTAEGGGAIKTADGSAFLDSDTAIKSLCSSASAGFLDLGAFEDSSQAARGLYFPHRGGAGPKHTETHTKYLLSHLSDVWLRMGGRGRERGKSSDGPATLRVDLR